MQVDQRRRRHSGNAQLHAGADGGIQHPRRHDDDNASRYFDVDNLAASTPLRILPPKPTPIEGVPPVVNFYFLPDMGRMTPRWLWGESRGYLPVRIAVGSAPR
jgi:hypothetical protein